MKQKNKVIFDNYESAYEQGELTAREQAEKRRWEFYAEV